MTQTFAASIEAWSEKAIRNAELVVKGSAADVSEIMTRRQPSVADTGGTFAEGRVPVDTGELIGSVVVEIAGVRTAQGSKGQPPDFTAGILSMELGQDIVVAFTAPYARRLEYGFSGTDSLGRTYSTQGRFFVRDAIQQWETIVAQNAALFED